MRRMMTILAGTLLASSLLASAAEARGGGGGFGGGVHMGGNGMHRVGKFTPSHNDGYGERCYYPEEAPKAPPWPPFCG
jgi:Spy/CpxP family protein refolding chaperone